MDEPLKHHAKLRMQIGKNIYHYNYLNGMSTVSKLIATEKRLVVPGSGKNGGKQRLPMDVGSLPGLN